MGEKDAKIISIFVETTVAISEQSGVQVHCLSGIIAGWLSTGLDQDQQLLQRMARLQQRAVTMMSRPFALLLSAGFC